MNVKDIIAGIIARITGETAADRIRRKQAEIAAVTTRNTQTINATIDSEIDSVATAARVAFGRIDQLLGTGALNTNKARAVDTARAQIDRALQQLDAALA